MAQNEQHNTVDGRAPIDQPIIDESGRLDPTREEAIRALAIINGDAAPVAATGEDEKKKSLLPPVLEDPRNEISKNFRTNRGRDTAEAKEDLDIARVDPANQAAIYGSEIAGQQPEQGAPLAAPVAVQQSPKFKVKIDGQERDVTQEELIATYQKNQAADQRLAEANRMRNEATAMLQAASTRAADGESPKADHSASTEQREQASIPNGTKFDRAKLANAVEKIAFGTTEEGSDALGELLTSVAPQQPQSLDINSQVETALAHRDYRKQSEDTTRKFVEKYPSIATDPIIQTMSGELVAQEMIKDFVGAGISLDVIKQTLPNRQAVKTFYDHLVVNRPDLVRPIDQLFESASQDARFKALVGAQVVPITTNVDRSDRKAMVQQQPAHRTPVAPQASQAQPASRDQRNSDAVARMRQARGQSTAA